MPAFSTYRLSDLAFEIDVPLPELDPYRASPGEVETRVRWNPEGPRTPALAPPFSSWLSGDDAEFVIRPSDFVMTWAVRCRRGVEIFAESRHSTLEGMLLTREDLDAAPVSAGAPLS